MNNFNRSTYPTKENYKLVDEFSTTFWSGLDVQVYAGNIWLKDCLQVNYQILETVRPYWHYSHYVPSRLHHGTRMIQGELSLNFTRDSYLFAVLQRLATQGPLATEHGPNLSVPTNVDGTQTGDPILYNVYPWGPQTGRKVLTEEMTADQRLQFVLQRKKAMDQERLALAKSRPLIPQFQGLFETGPGGFDLNLVFGAYLSRPLSLRYAASEDNYFLDGATFPDMRANPGPLGTGLKIVGVDIQGKAKSISDDGRPLVETYTFLARDVRILVPEDIAEFPDYASVFSQTAETHLGPTTTLRDIQDFMKNAQNFI